MTAAPKRNAGRSRLIGALHAAAKKQGLAEDDRRALQLRLVGKSSAADMTPAEIGKVLDALNANAGARRPSLGQSWQRKVRALWISAHQLGMTESASDAALDAFVSRQAGVSALRFLPPTRASSVIEALKDWMARPVAEGGGGVDWHGHGSHKWDDRHCIALAIWERLAALTAVQDADFTMLDAYARRALSIHQHRPLTGDEWGRVLPILAAKLATAKAHQEEDSADA